MYMHEHSHLLPDYSLRRRGRYCCMGSDISQLVHLRRRRSRARLSFSLVVVVVVVVVVTRLLAFLS